MRLRTRFSAALAAALVSVAGAAAADGPAVVAQSQPLGETVALFRGLAKKYGGPDAAAKFDAGIVDKLGEKKFTGLDLTRPVRGYYVATDDPQQPGGVVLIPITTAEDFLDLAKRAKLTVVKLKQGDGLYAVELPEGANTSDKPIRLRFEKTYAYVSVNLPDAALTADKLVAPEAVAVPGPPSLFAMRTFLQRMPADAVAANEQQVEQVKGMLDGAPVPEQLKASLGKLIDSGMSFNQRQYKEGDTYDLRYDLDAATDELTMAVVFQAKAGTPLAKEIAAYQAPTNRFVSLLSADTVVGFVTRLPLFTPEIRETVAGAVKLGVESQEGQIPPPVRPLADEAAAGVLRTIKAGAFDLGFAVNGPLKDGGHSVSFGISFEDPKALEREARAAIKDGPEGVADVVKFDAEKADGVGIHVADLSAFVPPNGRKFFGDKTVLAFAFAPKALYASVGADAVARVKAGLAGKVGPAPVIKVVTNGGRILKLVEASGDPVPADVKKMFAESDSLTTALSLSVAGGETMTVTFRMNAGAFMVGFFAGLQKQAEKPE